MLGNQNVLIIDDQIAIQKLLTSWISRLGHSCKTTGTLHEARHLLKYGDFRIVFLDIYLPDGNGIDFIADILDRKIPPVIIVITASAELGNVHKALMKGAWNYLVKPFSMVDVNNVLQRALNVAFIERVYESKIDIEHKIVGSSKNIIQSVRTMFQAAENDAPVLITGASGTGKEMFANEIHRLSRRSANPFVVVDCAILPENLVESILFGHVKGAFTGAYSERTGLVRQADRGTLFLDEIGELPLEMQKKFLRVIQEKSVMPIGGKDHIGVDFRLVCATNRDIRNMVIAGTFREDLFYRINVFPVKLSPLNERQEDIRILAEFFIAQICKQHSLEVRVCSSEFIVAIELYNWPGNVRELKNVFEKIILTSKEKVIYPDHLPENIREYIIQQNILNNLSNTLIPSLPAYSKYPKNDDTNNIEHELHSEIKPNKDYEADLNLAKNITMPIIKSVREKAISEAEQNYLKELIRFTNGNTAEAIKISGLAKSQFYRLLKKYNITKLFNIS
ncbi:MAG: sigma-54-dependent Fis family transcriptional regulator [Desulfamplus sp.]|nr:sigma-54-dependent Fis family transcriptional regulator [Desulfamplus sp.]